MKDVQVWLILFQMVGENINGEKTNALLFPHKKLFLYRTIVKMDINKVLYIFWSKIAVKGACNKISWTAREKSTDARKDITVDSGT